ncbi:MAG: ABC transporter ATP-binding protein [Eubacterium sp.]|nr:ABC transporter ATP-binding protein [Eubacterium sp.]
MNKKTEQPILQVKNLHFRYNDEKETLKGINLEIHQGEKIAVLGSNGAGKSTFFLNINGVLKSSAGEICYRGKKIDKKNLNDLRKNVGIVFQDADNQIIASTVEAEVSFGPMNLKLPRQEVIDRVNKALAYMNISDFKKRAPHYLSGGEKKRVSIADIIAMESEIIIFDEPTAALDPLNAAMLEEVLGKMSQEGRTMLISTHDVDFAYRWADRAVVFSNGQIIADDTPVNIFKQEDILEQASLKHPTMFDIYRILEEKGMVPSDGDCPRNVQEFQVLMDKLPLLRSVG